MEYIKERRDEVVQGAKENYSPVWKDLGMSQEKVSKTSAEGIENIMIGFETDDYGNFSFDAGYLFALQEVKRWVKYQKGGDNG